MTIIQLHTPNGVVNVDSETVTDKELAKLGMTREALNELLPDESLVVKIADLEARVEKLEKKVKR